MDLINFLRVLARRIWIILGVTALAVITTFLITRGSPKMYKSTAQLSTGITDKVKLDNNAEWVQWEKIQNDFNNLTQAMISRQAVSLLSYKLIQHDLNTPEPFRDLAAIKSYYAKDDLRRANVAYQSKYEKIETLYATSKNDQVPLEILKKAGYDYETLIKRLEIKRRGESDFIEVNFTSDNPRLSAFVVNNFSEEFIRYYKEQRGAGTNAKLDIFKTALEEKREIRDQKSQALNDLQRKSGISIEGRESSSLIQQKYEYERKRDAEKQKIAALDAELVELKDKLGEDFNKVYDPSRSRRAEMVTLRTQITSMETRYLVSGSSNEALKDSIETLKRRRNELISEDMGSGNSSNTRDRLVNRKVDVELQLANARERLNSITDQLGKVYYKTNRLVAGSGELSKAMSESEEAEKDFQEALSRYNDAKDIKSEIGSNLKLYELGRPASDPQPSKAPLLITFSGLASLSLCVVLLFLFEYVDLSIKSPSNFLRQAGLPLMGSLNHLVTPSLKLESLFSERSNNPSLEKFKQLLRKLRYEVANSGAQSFLITSAKPGEGKTLALISLAYSLSLNGKKILLIDTNFKNPTLTSMLQATPKLEDWISKDLSLGEVISRSEFNGIDVIGCQGGDHSPAEALYDEKFKEVLGTLSHDYDYIFMEGASLNDYADAKELVDFSEKVIAVFSAKSILRQTDKETISYLQDLDDQFLGAILNDVENQNLEL